MSFLAFMYITLQTIVEYTHTSTHTSIKSICTHSFGKAGGGIGLQDASLEGRRLIEQIQLLFFYLFLSIYLLWYVDLAQLELRALCELVWLLNV